VSTLYEQSFNRNIGNITYEEQMQLKQSTVAIAGVGGVGGAALINIARIGFGAVKIADPEEFSYSDINRQEGATTKTVGQKKVDVLKKQLKEINPGMMVKTYNEGLTIDIVADFVEEASIIIDALEFFCLPLKKALFQHARKNGLYILSTPIFGFGTSLAVFSPDGPTFEECFGEIPNEIDGQYALNFGSSFFPNFPKYINMEPYLQAMKQNQPIPSFATSCALSGAVAAAEIVFILLNKRKPTCFPYVKHFDLFDASISIEDSRKKESRIQDITT
jgi:molybdopterin/thiamine biosynthesis adenylyltransferase